MSEKKLFVSENYIWNMEGYLRVFFHLKTDELLEKRKELGKASRNQNAQKNGKRRFSHEDLTTDSFRGISITRFPIMELRARDDLLRNGFVVLVRDYKGNVLPYIAPKLLAYFGAEDAKRMLLFECSESIMLKILAKESGRVPEVSKIAPTLPWRKSRNFNNLSQEEMAEFLDCSVRIKDLSYQIKGLRYQTKRNPGDLDLANQRMILVKELEEIRNHINMLSNNVKERNDINGKYKRKRKLKQIES